MMVFFFVHFLAHSEKTNQMRGVTPKAPFKGGCNRSSCRSYIKEPSGHQSPGVVEMTRNGIEMTRNLS